MFQMSSRIEKAASFTRGFFGFLEDQRVRAVVLYGGDDGFERELSDVDFAVGPADFERLPELVRSHAASHGWLLCQILRHETTAAYFVCCAANDPRCVVALDACSDYQRHGTRFIDASELLANRQRLDWGGFGLTPGMELSYRFAKSAAKAKDADASIREFSVYPHEARIDCKKWLEGRFGIRIEAWTASEVQFALSSLRERCRKRPHPFHPDSVNRIVSRMIQPSGLVVIAGRGDFESTSASLRDVFGNVYFRRFLMAQRWRASMVKNLMASTLIVVPQLPFPWNHLIPGDCRLVSTTTRNPQSLPLAVAARLAERCERRSR